ncbi:hypothetical protein Q8X06_31000 [Pseudomonas aeruginosa]|uniref:hypothetical protein n=1 Tax=Pseudomonas aeruginosa TaxID=287 RepID=UPI0029050869|nr:hypothetical protein [Pseudomonas aeruginosa]MDU0536682.1 hypothetical protein [Pseudomonas aeruginosa]
MNMHADGEQITAIDTRERILLTGATESPRVLRRLQLLRKWSHEQEQQIFA